MANRRISFAEFIFFLNRSLRKYSDRLRLWKYNVSTTLGEARR